MQPSALIQRTERLLQQAHQALYRTPSIPTLAHLTRQLGALRQLVEAYGLRIPIGALAGYRADLRAPADDESTDAAHYPMEIGLNRPQSTFLPQTQRTGFGLTDRETHTASQVAFHSRDVMLRTVGALSGRSPDRTVEADHQRELHSSATGDAPALRHVPPAPASTALGPTASGSAPRVQDAAEHIGGHREDVPLSVPRGRHENVRHPRPRQTVLPVTNIARVQTTWSATAPSTAGVTPVDMRPSGSASDRIQAPQRIIPTAHLASPGSTTSTQVEPSDQLGATGLSSKPSERTTATGMPAHLPDTQFRTGLRPRALPVGAAEHGPARPHRRQAVDIMSRPLLRPQQPPPAVGRPTTGQPDGHLGDANSGADLFAQHGLFDDVDGKDHIDVDPDALSSVISSQEDLQRLAGQLERLLRDEARRHGIDL